MSSSERLRGAGAQGATGEAYIDWGLPLPAGYPGGRVRVMVVDPHLVRASWELSRPGVVAWEVAVEGARGESLARLELPADASDAWLRVPARSRGLVRLLAKGDAGAALVATVPFETPADGPSAPGDEVWAQVGADGRLMTVSPPPGRSADALPGVGGVPTSATYPRRA